MVDVEVDDDDGTRVAAADVPVDVAVEDVFGLEADALLSVAAVGAVLLL